MVGIYCSEAYEVEEASFYEKLCSKNYEKLEALQKFIIGLQKTNMNKLDQIKNAD